MLSLLAQTRLFNPAIKNTIGNLTNSAQGGTVVQLFLRNLINLSFGMGGLVFLFMLLRGGYEYMTAGGDKESTQKAMKRITTAFVGIAILFSVFALLLIVETLFGINIRQFSIPTI